MSKTNCDDPSTHFAETIISFFFLAVSNVFCNYTIRIGKGILGKFK